MRSSNNGSTCLIVVVAVCSFLYASILFLQVMEEFHIVIHAHKGSSPVMEYKWIFFSSRKIRSDKHLGEGTFYLF